MPTAWIPMLLLFFTCPGLQEDVNGGVAEKAPSLERFFPGPDRLGDGIEAEDYMEYDRKTLFDYIDGGAEAYLRLGFRRVGTREYKVPLKEETYFTLDVYDMAGSKNAFGIYRMERPPEAAPVKVGVEGWYGGGTLCFWNGPYYVKLRADDEGKAVNALLLKMARGTAAHMGKAGAFPEELLLFPPSSRKRPVGEQYTAEGLLGLSKLGGFTCPYSAKEGALVLYLCRFPGQKEGERAEAEFAKRLSPPPVPAEDGQGLRFHDRGFGRGRCLRVGAFFGVAIYKPAGGKKGKAPDWMEEIVQVFFGRLTKAAMKDKTDKALKALMGEGGE